MLNLRYLCACMTCVNKAHSFFFLLLFVVKERKISLIKKKKEKFLSIKCSSGYLSDFDHI